MEPGRIGWISGIWKVEPAGFAKTLHMWIGFLGQRPSALKISLYNTEFQIFSDMPYLSCIQIFAYGFRGVWSRGHPESTQYNVMLTSFSSSCIYSKTYSNLLN